jgi:hypothetical protein
LFSDHCSKTQHYRRCQGLWLCTSSLPKSPYLHSLVVPQSIWHYNPLTLRYMMSQQNIQSPPILEDFWFATFFHETHLIHVTTSEESLRVLFFTRSLAVDLVH